VESRGERVESPGDRGEQEREERISRLALRYRSGDRAALGDLYAAVEPLVHHFLRAHLSDPRSLPCGVEPADLYQQAYVALADTALEWHSERRDNFMPYFFHSFPWRIDHYLKTQTPACVRQSGVAQFDHREWPTQLWRPASSTLSPLSFVPLQRAPETVRLGARLDDVRSVGDAIQERLA